MKSAPHHPPSFPFNPRDRSKRPVTLIKVRVGSPVRIHCPRPDKYPAFARAFHGRAGVVVEIEPKGAADVIRVDVSTKAEAGAWISVERSWLQHNDGRRLA
jgi:hypothetical protein